jgi:hypothetical protein
MIRHTLCNVPSPIVPEARLRHDVGSDREGGNNEDSGIPHP